MQYRSIAGQLSLLALARQLTLDLQTEIETFTLTKKNDPANATADANQGRSDSKVLVSPAITRRYYVGLINFILDSFIWISPELPACKAGVVFVGDR